MTETEILNGADEAMKGRISKLLRDFSGLRTGRASAQLVEPVRVEYYGQQVPLKQVAAISVPEARVIEIRPWDAAALPEIEKALQKADVGAMPQSDGKLIRINLPMMTEERRKDMVKVVKRMAEEGRVSVRAERHEALEKIRKAEKAKEIGQDQAKGLEAKLQKLTDSHIARVEQEAAVKEKEITTI